MKTTSLTERSSGKPTDQWTFHLTARSRWINDVMTATNSAPTFNVDSPSSEVVMANTDSSDYLLTVLQHNYCSDCMWIKGKITDVYHASSLMRGEDSKTWRINIISPAWDRGKRALGFPKGFENIDVPALKLEVDGRILFATQNPALIDAALLKLKGLLMARKSNSEISSELQLLVRDWKDAPATSCKVRPEVFTRSNAVRN